MYTLIRYFIIIAFLHFTWNFVLSYTLVKSNPCYNLAFGIPRICAFDIHMSLHRKYISKLQPTRYNIS